MRSVAYCNELRESRLAGPDGKGNTARARVQCSDLGHVRRVVNK